MSFLRYEWKNSDIQHGLLLFVLLVIIGSPAHEVPAQARQKSRSSEQFTNDLVHDRLLGLDVRPKDPPQLPVEAVVEKMTVTSARRSSQLQGYRCKRNYHLQYHGLFGAREASMVVTSTYSSPDKLEFKVESESGSKLLINRVLLKLLESEREAMRNQAQIEISPANYDFKSLGIDKPSGDDPSYVLAVTPRTDNRFLYHGTIWIDAYDFALVKMEGHPARSPSFWIKDTEISSNWANTGGFYLIQHSRSESHIRMGGMAILTIDYSDYALTVAGGTRGGGQSPQLPAPGAVTPQR